MDRLMFLVLVASAWHVFNAALRLSAAAMTGKEKRKPGADLLNAKVELWDS